MKTIQIQDLEFEKIGEVKKIATYIEVNPLEYHLSSGTAQCKVTFGDSQNMEVARNIPINFTKEEMDAWVEDSYLESLILSKIGAIKKTEE